MQLSLYIQLHFEHNRFEINELQMYLPSEYNILHRHE
jgi:hypothetical protein